LPHSDGFEITSRNSVNTHIPAGRAVSLLSVTRQPNCLCAAGPARGESPSGWFVLALLLTACLVPRTIMAWTMPGICPDAVLYIRLGKAIEAGQFQTALGQIRFNIYPFILSFLHQLGLPWETAGVAWGVVISSCTVVPLYGWIRRTFNSRVAISGCLLYAIHSGLIRWSVEIIRDSTFWFLLAMSLYLLWRAVTELRWTWYLAAGTAIALACLTRFEGLVLLVPLFGWSWWRCRENSASCRRMIAAGLVCASIYPLSFLLINKLWLHGPTTNLIRSQPVVLAQDWAQESITGQRAVENQRRTDLLAPLPSWKMAERFSTGMFKGITPLYLIAFIGGIAAWYKLPVGGIEIRLRSLEIDAGIRRAPRIDVAQAHQPVRHLAWRRDFRALACAAALILVAIWVHLYWSHEAASRYFFPIVLMAAPLAGWGLLQISAAVAHRARRRYAPQVALLAGAAPLVAMLVVNLSVAWGSDLRGRAATVDLGHWVQARYGSSAKLLGPDGITQVVSHYSQVRSASFPETASAATVVGQMNRFHPDIVLLSTDRRATWGDELLDHVTALGFGEIDRASLPGGCEKLHVLVRPTGDGSPAMDGKRSVRGPEGISTACEARYPPHVASRGDKPRS
jgi:hypothetical protein